MARKRSITVWLDREDAEALARARKDGLAASDLIRRACASSLRATTGIVVRPRPGLSSQLTPSWARSRRSSGIWKGEPFSVRTFLCAHLPRAAGSSRRSHRAAIVLV
jgi:hypothetical protein